MSAIERRGGIPGNHNELLSPEEQGAIELLREDIPADIFDQASEIVFQHFNQGGEQLLAFSPVRKLDDEQKLKILP